MIEFVKLGCLVCIVELIAAFLKFMEVEEFTEANGGNKKYVFPKFVCVCVGGGCLCVGWKGRGGNSVNKIKGILLKDDQSSIFIY